MLTNWQTDLLKNAELQTSDATTLTIDLPRDGHLSVLDLIFAATNGATSNNAYGVTAGTAGQRLLDIITKLEIIANGSKTLLSVTNVEDLIAEAMKITGKIPARRIEEGVSDVQRVHVPIYFGRFIDDKLVVIPNGPYMGGNFFDSLQLKITYNMTIAATAFATGTFTVSAAVKKLVDDSPPESKLVKTFQHKEDYTTTGGTTKSINLTYGPNLFMRSVQVYAYEAAVAEGVDVTKLQMDYNSKGGGKVTIFENEWKVAQKHNASVYGLDRLTFSGLSFVSDADTIKTRVPDIKGFEYHNVDALADVRVISSVESLAGDTLTVATWGYVHVTTPAGTANTTDADQYWSVVTDVIPRYAYVDFDESKSLDDLLDTGGMTALVLKMTDGAVGAAVRVNEEFIMRAIDFRSS